MVTQKVDIRVKDKYIYTQIAFLVDREDFRTDILRLRKKWTNTTEPSSLSFFMGKIKGFIYKDDNLTGTVDDEPAYKYKLTDVYSIKIRTNKLLSGPIIKKPVKSNDKTDLLLLDIHSLMWKYHIPETQYFGILSAVISGKVMEYQWNNCEIEVFPPSEDINPTRNSKEPYCFIHLTPYTSKSELLKLFDENTPEIKRLYQKSEYGYKEYAKDTISNIERDRKWYWQNLPVEKGGENKSYLMIAKEQYGKVHGYVHRDMVRKAIKQYQKNLNSS